MQGADDEEGPDLAEQLHDIVESMLLEVGFRNYERPIRTLLGQSAPFANLRHARELISAWRDDYNHHRPHTSLDGLTPWEYHQRSVEDQNLNRAN
ncbi:hypothetical protein GCM10017056_45990 [Seohaeicola zhoushanensis]|uniref:Integrase catalytic domain-containing protein n=1 Tax=Seohaeicola zhoushanensis TaxID=1569283 RepID=A0A8J3H155_9RHOB|nr:hypothetical protein GCM10017056_45990 [Seohaeicola zhoushanensis]